MCREAWCVAQEHDDISPGVEGRSGEALWLLIAGYPVTIPEDVQPSLGDVERDHCVE